VNFKEALLLMRDMEELVRFQWKLEPRGRWDFQTSSDTFSRPVHTLHLNQLLKDVQKTYAPAHSFLVGSMHGVRVGEEVPHSVATQHGLLFTLTRATPTLKENVFPDFYESEQGPDYADGLTEEPRDPEPP
jgi:hypothetical protein